MEPTIKLEHADSRGEIYSIELPDGRELMLLHSVAGALRGGHSHDCGEVVVLLSGKMHYYKVKPDKYPGSEEIWIEEMFPGQSSFNSAGLIHMGAFSEDSWLVEYKLAAKGSWSQTDYEPMRERVRASANVI